MNKFKIGDITCNTENYAIITELVIHDKTWYYGMVDGKYVKQFGARFNCNDTDLHEELITDIFRIEE